MKSIVQYLLQLVLGYENYLWIFTKYKLNRLKNDTSEKDFFHFLKMLKEGDRVLDIGANLGLMSYFLSSKVKRVDAFEPIPSNLMILEKLKAKRQLENLLIHATALGNENGSIELVLPVVKGVRKQGLSHVKHEKMTDFNQGESFVSSIYKLDDYPELGEERIGGIKIDVENFEYEVFLGAKQRIVQDQPIIYSELWDNQNRYDCFEFFKNIGYNIYALEQAELRPLDQLKSPTQNFFFLPNGHNFAQ